MAVKVSRRTLRRLVTAGLAVITVTVPLSAQQPQQGATTLNPSASGPTLTLTMAQAVQMALETNLGLKGEKINVDIASQSITGARAAFLPQLTGTFSRNNTESFPVRNSDGTQTVPTSNRLSGSATVQQQLSFYGGAYSATWGGNRNGSGGFSTFNPSLGSNLSLRYDQPLWRDLKIDQARGNLDRTERQRVVSDLNLQSRIVATEAAVRQAYLQLKAALENRNVAQLNVDIAETSLRNARARVQVGQSPELDIITAESQAAAQRGSLISANAQIATAEDNLRTLILDQGRPDYWSVTLVPADQILVTERQVDVDAAIKTALENRLDMQTLKRNMEITDLNIRLAENGTKPDVNAFVSYVASGTGGQKFNLDGSPELNVGFGRVVGDAFAGYYPSWTYGVNVAWPIGHNGAIVQKTQNELVKQQQLLSQRDLELAIVGDIRQAARDITTRYQRYLTEKTAREALEKQVEAENRKFAVGLSDTYQVQLRERDLANQRVFELQAIIGYNQALIEFERVQKIR